MVATAFMNTSGTLGGVMVAITQNATGSLFLTLLLLVFFIMALCVLFRLPIELSAIFVLPLMIASMSFMTEFYSVGGVFLIYVGVLLAKNLFFR